MWLLIVASICWNLPLPSNAQHSTPIVNIQGLGSVQGSIGHTTWTSRTIYQFQGIPYAQSPVGTLRFQVILVQILIASVLKIFSEASSETSRMDRNPRCFPTKRTLSTNYGSVHQRRERRLSDVISLLKQRELSTGVSAVSSITVLNSPNSSTRSVR